MRFQPSLHKHTDIVHFASRSPGSGTNRGTCAVGCSLCSNSCSCFRRIRRGPERHLPHSSEWGHAHQLPISATSLLSPLDICLSNLLCRASSPCAPVCRTRLAKFASLMSNCRCTSGRGQSNGIQHSAIHTSCHPHSACEQRRCVLYPLHVFLTCDGRRGTWNIVDPS